VLRYSGHGKRNKLYNGVYVNGDKFKVLYCGTTIGWYISTIQAAEAYDAALVENVLTNPLKPNPERLFTPAQIQKLNFPPAAAAAAVERTLNPSKGGRLISASKLKTLRYTRSISIASEHEWSAKLEVINKARADLDTRMDAAKRELAEQDHKRGHKVQAQQQADSTGLTELKKPPGPKSPVCAKSQAVVAAKLRTLRDMVSNPIVLKANDFVRYTDKYGVSTIRYCSNTIKAIEQRFRPALLPAPYRPTYRSIIQILSSNMQTCPQVREKVMHIARALDIPPHLRVRPTLGGISRWKDELLVHLISMFSPAAQITTREMKALTQRINAAYAPAPTV
jgi:hypothetical protein